MGLRTLSRQDTNASHKHGMHAQLVAGRAVFTASIIHPPHVARAGRTPWLAKNHGFRVAGITHSVAMIRIHDPNGGIAS